MRIGHGYDVHRFVAGRRLILGGVEIPNAVGGLAGHSDADVLIHAIMDALLGAMALGDIGKLFPDTAPEYKNISSMILLKKVMGLVSGNGYSVGNIDATVVCEAPKLSPYIDAMRNNIAEACGVEASFVGVKATTEEGLGLAGKGAAAHAVVVIN